MTGTLDDQEEDCDKSLLRNRATPATDQNQCRRTTIYERSARSRSHSRRKSGSLSPSLVIPRGLPDSSGIDGYFTSRYQFRIGLWGILHPDTSFVPSIPEESGIQRGMAKNNQLEALYGRYANIA